MQALGYIISTVPWRRDTVLYQLYLAHVDGRIGSSVISISKRINPTRHFKSPKEAVRYAEKYFLHLKRTSHWRYVGNVTNLMHILYAPYTSEQTWIRQYKTGRYYTIAKKLRGKPRSLRRSKAKC